MTDGPTPDPAGSDTARAAQLGLTPDTDPAKPAGAVRVLMIGDVIGKPGRVAVEQTLPGLRDDRQVDLVTANGENLAGGMGLTVSTAQGLFDAGVDVITSGNHIWDKREIYPVLETDERILRPHNYGSHAVPGRGWGSSTPMTAPRSRSSTSRVGRTCSRSRTRSPRRTD